MAPRGRLALPIRSFAVTAVVFGITVGFASTAAGAAPERAAKYPAKGTYAYETVYNGSYEYTYEITAHSKNQDVHWTSDNSYTWSFILLDVFHDDGHMRYTEVRSVGENASGHADTKRDVSNATTQDDVDENCQITSKDKSFDQRFRGEYADPTIGDPKVTTFWAVPAYADATGIYIHGWAGYHAAPGVSANCVRRADGQTTRSTIPDGHTVLHSPLSSTDWGYDNYAALDWRDKAVPSCGGDYLAPSADFFRLWEGKGVAGLMDLPFEQSFGFHKSISGRMTPGKAPISGATSASCNAHVSYETNVKMSALTVSRKGTLVPTPNDGGPAPNLDHDTPADPPGSGEPVNKVGQLFLADGLAVLAGNAVEVPHGLASGQQAKAQVLFPGMPETGVATFEVSGQVISPHREQAATARASSSPVLISGSAKLPAHTLTRFDVALTSAGRSVFTRHRSKPVRVDERLVFNPDKHGAHNLVVTKTVTIPPP